MQARRPITGTIPLQLTVHAFYFCPRIRVLCQSQHCVATCIGNGKYLLCKYLHLHARRNKASSWMRLSRRRAIADSSWVLKYMSHHAGMPYLLRFFGRQTQRFGICMCVRMTLVQRAYAGYAIAWVQSSVRQSGTGTKWSQRQRCANNRRHLKQSREQVKVHTWKRQRAFGSLTVWHHTNCIQNANS